MSSFFSQTITSTLSCACCLLSFTLQADDTNTFANPIIPAHSADPFVVQHNGDYYHIANFKRGKPGIGIHKAKELTQLAQAPFTQVWQAPETGPYSKEIWAPELHHYNGHWYIYFAGDNGKNENHQMWVVESEGDDPMGPYIQEPHHLETGGWAIDGTFLTDAQNRPYFIWSGWPGKTDGTQYLYIAPMESPTKISEKRTLLSIPEYAWEKNAMPLLEGPEILKYKGKVFIIYSASGSWTPDYCLGMLEYTGGLFCDPNNWKKHNNPVFSREGSVYGPGHCSFVLSPDATENWIVYHTKSTTNNGWGDRRVHIQPFEYDEYGIPQFGKPVQPNVQIAKPSVKQEKSTK